MTSRGCFARRPLAKRLVLVMTSLSRQKPALGRERDHHLPSSQRKPRGGQVLRPLVRRPQAHTERYVTLCVWCSHTSTDSGQCQSCAVRWWVCECWSWACVVKVLGDYSREPYWPRPTARGSLSLSIPHHSSSHRGTQSSKPISVFTGSRARRMRLRARSAASPSCEV